MISPGATSSPNGGRRTRRGTNLQFGLRRGQRPRALVTTTPRPIGCSSGSREDPVDHHAGRTSDNINLDEKVIDVMTATYGGTRIGRQELDGELLTTSKGRCGRGS